MLPFVNCLRVFCNSWHFLVVLGYSCCCYCCCYCYYYYYIFFSFFLKKLQFSSSCCFNTFIAKTHCWLGKDERRLIFLVVNFTHKYTQREEKNLSILPLCTLGVYVKAFEYWQSQMSLIFFFLLLYAYLSFFFFLQIYRWRWDNEEEKGFFLLFITTAASRDPAASSFLICILWYKIFFKHLIIMDLSIFAYCFAII